MFLTPDELEELTGYKTGKRQRGWLVEHGYKFEVRADGKPAVLSSHVAVKLGGPREPRAAQPNWDALR